MNSNVTQSSIDSYHLHEGKGTERHIILSVLADIKGYVTRKQLAYKLKSLGYSWSTESTISARINKLIELGHVVVPKRSGIKVRIICPISKRSVEAITITTLGFDVYREQRMRDSA